MISQDAINAALQAFLTETVARKGELGAGAHGVLAALEAAAPLIDEYNSRAIEAVLDLHREELSRDDDGDLTSGSYCVECKDHDDFSGERVYEAYPCPTVSEIKKALHGEQTLMELQRRIERGM